MKLTKLFLLLASVSALVVSSDGSAFAGSATKPLYVGATVAANCTITTSAISFGAYDPLGVNATDPLTATGKVSIACTKGTTTHIGLDTGLHPGGSTGRQMAGGTPASTLPYSLFQPDNVTAWGNAAPSWLATPGPANLSPVDYVVNGEIPPAQNVSPGIDYADTVTATVNF